MLARFATWPEGAAVRWNHGTLDVYAEAPGARLQRANGSFVARRLEERIELTFDPSVHAPLVAWLRERPAPISRWSRS